MKCRLCDAEDAEVNKESPKTKVKEPPKTKVDVSAAEQDDTLTSAEHHERRILRGRWVK